MPGALTPTEVVRAWKAGADLVKVFPCGAVGGPSYIRALKAPFPQIDFIPTGGVSLKTAPEFIQAGASALGAGADLVDLAAIREGKASSISEKARQYCQRRPALVQVVRPLDQGISSSSDGALGASGSTGGFGGSAGRAACAAACAGHGLGRAGIGSVPAKRERLGHRVRRGSRSRGEDGGSRARASRACAPSVDGRKGSGPRDAGHDRGHARRARRRARSGRRRGRRAQGAGARRRGRDSDRDVGAGAGLRVAFGPRARACRSARSRRGRSSRAAPRARSLRAGRRVGLGVARCLHAREASSRAGARQRQSIRALLGVGDLGRLGEGNR